MRIRAEIHNEPGIHRVTVTTDDRSHALDVQPKPSGGGSRTNGGEALMLALATCYCNDIYREAAARGIAIDEVEVEADADFGAPGEPARNIRYRARVVARGASGEDVRRLLEHTDTVAEVHNTLRKGAQVTLDGVDVEVRS